MRTRLQRKASVAVLPFFAAENGAVRRCDIVFFCEIC